MLKYPVLLAYGEPMMRNTHWHTYSVMFSHTGNFDRREEAYHVSCAVLVGKGLITCYPLPQIAELVAYLCSSAARQMTGSVLTIDGGWTAL